MKMIRIKRQTNPNTVLCAVVAGAAAGLAVGLMMAPKSGQQLRTDIGSTVDDYLGSAAETAESLKASATSLAQRGLREVQKTKDLIAHKVNEAVNRGEKEAHGAIDRAASAANSAAVKSHEVVSETAAEARTGTHG